MAFEAIVWKLYDISYNITKLMYLNLLWIGFSLLGLVVLGIFPATAAMFAVSRKWVLGEKDTPIFATFWKVYKKSFVQMNIIGYLSVLIGWILYIDLKFFQNADSAILSIFAFLIIFVLILYFAVILYIFPMYVHFRFKTIEYFKQALILVIAKPMNTIMMIVGSYLLYVVLSRVPVLWIFVSGSLASLVLMWIAMKSFPRYESEAGDVE